MGQQIFLRSVLLLGMAAFCGCRKPSPPAEQAKPGAANVSTPVPAQSVAVPAPKRPEDLLKQTAAKTFQVTLPASFSADQVPANEISEFLVAGEANKLLRIEVKEDTTRAQQQEIAAQVAGGALLKPVTQYECPDEELYPLTQGAMVRVVYSPHGHKNALRFSFVDKSDPMLNAVLTPQQVSIDFGGLGQETGIEVEPYIHSCGVGSSWPSDLVVKSHAGWLRIIQVEGYKRVFPNDVAMQVLVSSLSQRSNPTDANKLPFADDDDAAIVMTARPEWIEGQGWKGWRWIEGSSQDGAYPGGLGYTFEGVTNDGRFFLRMIGQISHPELKRLDPINVLEEGARGKAERENRLLLKKIIVKADPASFTPNLNDIDTMIRSIRIQQ
jgi:hypothetical protein